MTVWANDRMYRTVCEGKNKITRLVGSFFFFWNWIFGCVSSCFLLGKFVLMIEQYLHIVSVEDVHNTQDQIFRVFHNVIHHLWKRQYYNQTSLYVYCCEYAICISNDNSCKFFIEIVIHFLKDCWGLNLSWTIASFFENLHNRFANAHIFYW